jgi:hypothetical protein
LPWIWSFSFDKEHFYNEQIKTPKVKHGSSIGACASATVENLALRMNFTSAKLNPL